MRGLWFLSATPCRLAQIYPMPCFRPLAGIMVLIDIAKGVYISAMLEVSVPLRGLWFLSRTHVKGEIIMMKQVSVPLRGLWFLSILKKFETTS